MASNDFMANVMNAINGVDNYTESNNPIVLGLGFHKFDGNVTTQEVMEQIGADFQVEKQPIARLTPDMMEAITNGLPIILPPSMIIGTHAATVNMRDNTTLGVVGSDYGVIQNTQGLDILDLLCNAEISGGNYQIVSGGLVHDSDPYIQVRLPNEIRVNGDNSRTDLYASFHTRHDGKGGLKVAISAIRIVCQNTFTANFKSKTKLNFRHTKNVGQLLNFESGDNIKRLTKMIEGFNIFSAEHLNKLNALAKQQITEQYINEVCNQVFVNDAELQKLARQHNYNWDVVSIANPETPDKPKTISVRAQNQIQAFRNTLESGIGQDTNRGSKYWLYNGLTNYFSNDYEYTSAEKRFANLTEGTASEKINSALEFMLAEV